MKLAVTVATPDARKAAVVTFSGDLPRSLRKVAELGYDGVELLTRAPRLLRPKALKSVLQQHSLGLAAIVTGEMYGEDGLCLVHPDRQVVDRALVRMEDALQLAAEFGAMVNIGRFRGRLLPGASLDQTWTTAAERMRQCADRAQPYGVRIVLEPANRYEVDFVHSAQDGLRMVREVDRPNFGLMLDTFHMNIEDRSIYQSLREARPYLWHVHVADSNRHAPGSGHLNFRSIVATLREIGYKGYLCAEILPLPDGETAARRAIEHLRPLVKGGTT